MDLFVQLYGYIPNTISGNGEELDAYLLSVFEPVEEYSDDVINALTEFQEQYFEHIIIRNEKH